MRPWASPFPSVDLSLPNLLNGGGHQIGDCFTASLVPTLGFGQCSKENGPEARTAFLIKGALTHRGLFPPPYLCSSQSLQQEYFLSPPLLWKAQLRFMSSMELSPASLSFRIPIALTGDSVPSCRAHFSLPALPDFQAFSCTCHVVQLVADSLKCKLHLSLSCQGCGLTECWISVGELSARETPNHSPLCKIPRRDTGTQNLSS